MSRVIDDGYTDGASVMSRYRLTRADKSLRNSLLRRRQWSILTGAVVTDLQACRLLNRVRKDVKSKQPVVN